MKKLLILVVVFLLFPSATLTGQDPLSLIEKLEKVTKDREPDWTLDRKLPIEQVVVLRWSSGESRIFMSIFLTASSGKAKESLDTTVASMNEQTGTKPQTIPDLGEESFLWPGDNAGRSARLAFRQGKVQVLLFAPTEDVAKRFGGYVLATLPKPKEPKVQTSQPNWKEYSSAEGRFSILFPGKVTEEAQVTQLAPGVELRLRIFKHETVAESSVMYADYPMPLDDPAMAKSVLDAGAKGAAATINAEVLELKEITLDGFPGRYLKERLTSNEIMRVKMYLVGQRLYQIAITTPAEQGMSADKMKNYDAMADKFLNSFKILKKDEKKLTAQVYQRLTPGITLHLVGLFTFTPFDYSNRFQRRTRNDTFTNC